ncbi:MAG: hypothetical protein QN210_05315 [Armatimonadota bacterium]|nr:hypothetical protein [Armatimonadota bacterium]
MARYEQVLMGESPPRGVGRPDEHARMLEGERQRVRAAREATRREARAHRRALEAVREEVARSRRYHRTALRQNRWILALAERLLAPRRAAETP